MTTAAQPVMFADKMREARKQLVFRYPFWSSIALGLIMEPSPVGTMATDGKRIFYDETWLSKLTLEETMGVIAHESAHCGLLHPFRTAAHAYNRVKANLAQDMVINIMLRDDGFILPGQPRTFEQMFKGETGYPYDPKWKGLSWEEVYAKMPEPPSSPKGSGKGKELSTEDVIPNTSASDETEAKVRVQQAAEVARQRGKLPAGMRELVEGLLEVKVDWRDLLRVKLKSRSKDDYNPRRHNRRLTGQGIYFPTLHSERMGEIHIAVDTSGSTMGDRKKFLTEMIAIAEEVRPSKLTVSFCDAKVWEVKEFEPTEYDLLRTTRIEFPGGGGTSFRPPFEWIEQSGRHPEIMVYFTDLYGDFPDEAPGYDVLWLSTSSEKTVPFGEVIQYESLPD